MRHATQTRNTTLQAVHGTGAIRANKPMERVRIKYVTPTNKEALCTTSLHNGAKTIALLIACNQRITSVELYAVGK